MAQQKQRNIKLNTPEGVAKFPWLSQPDTRFNDAGEYSVNLVLPEDDEKTIALKEKIDGIFATFQKTLKGAKAKKPADSLGYEAEFTEDGDETGNVIFKFKAKTGYISKKTNAWVPMNPPKLFDSKLQPIPNGTDIWGGSTMIVNFTPAPYDHGKNIGVTLRLNAVQIIQIVNGQAGQTAEGFGFGEEEGYTQAPDMGEEAYEDPEVPATNTDADEDDF